MKTIGMLCAASLALACQTSAANGVAQKDAAKTSQPAQAEPIGKPQAPVQIAAEVGDGVAQVSVRFEQDGTGVSIHASGADGLSVRGVTILASGRTVTAGEVARFEVPFTPGPGRSVLALTISGDFGGGPRSTVRSFQVGKPNAEQAKKAQDGVTQIGGENVKLVPAEETKK